MFDFVEGQPEGSRRELAEEEFSRYLMAGRWCKVSAIWKSSSSRATVGWHRNVCAGQMALTPLAAIYAGKPRELTWLLIAWHGTTHADGRDLNAAIVAGIARALTLDRTEFATNEAAWMEVEQNDPRYRSLRISRSPVGHTFNRRLARLCSALCSRGDGQPLKLRQAIEAMSKRQWWKRCVTFVMPVAATKWCHADPQATLRLCLDLGWDTDSTAQLQGPGSVRCTATKRFRWHAASGGRAFAARVRPFG